jgi:hypothetical protein
MAGLSASQFGGSAWESKANEILILKVFLPYALLVYCWYKSEKMSGFNHHAIDFRRNPFGTNSLSASSNAP